MVYPNFVIYIMRTTVNQKWLMQTWSYNYRFTVSTQSMLRTMTAFRRLL